MRSGIILAILASLVLVGGAFWYRSATPQIELGLVAIGEKKGNEAYYQELFLNSSTSTPKGSEEPIGGTDLVARQLMLDYINLANSGQATEANITDLAEKYVDSIPTLISVSKVFYLDLKIVPDSQLNFKNYAQEIGSIYNEYAVKMLGAYSAKAFSLGPQNSAMAGKMSNIYLTTSQKLKGISVPASLVEAHLSLTNAYLENAAAMESISQSEADPARAFAGIISIDTNLDKESVALNEIEKILNAEGI
jgi:hypothetical protein